MQRRSSSVRRWLLAQAIAGVMLAAAPAGADLDVVFVLDTTGSMGGEIREVQERVRQLAGSLQRAREGERVRFGVVAYRDRGDAYVTKRFDLSEDVSAAAAFLASLTATGGGDGPESVIAALAAALLEVSWDRSDGVDRQVFLIGDAPPHLDYAGDYDPDELIAAAREAHIVINSIGCRSLPSQGVRFFRAMAYATEGSYQHIGRVAAAEDHELTAAVARSVAPPAGAAVGGRELELRWLDHEDTESAGILVRQGGPEGIGQGREGDALAPCSLELRLPVGYGLSSPPRAFLAGDSLRVELVLDDGPGGRDLFTLSACPPPTTPIDIVLGGE